MKKTVKFKKKINDFFFDHYILNEVVRDSWMIIATLVAAAIYSFAFECFVTPVTGTTDITITTGGVGGVAQDIALILQLCHVPLDAEQMQSIFYSVVNVPICIFAFLTIGKKFSILTVINVVASSLFILLFKRWDFVLEIRGMLSGATSSSALNYGNVFVRTLFAGIFVGLGSGVAFKGDSSCGGIDVFSYYFGQRKSTSVGKYATAINLVIVTIYALILGASGTTSWSTAFINFLFSIAYLFITMLVVDAINTRNKKVSIQIITNREDLADILIANFPHAATVTKAKGAYSGADKSMIFMVTSSSEVKHLIAVIKKADPVAFIYVSPLNQVYGKFFIRPVE